MKKLCIFLAVVLLCLTGAGCRRIQFDNTVDARQQITKTYTSDRLEQLRAEVLEGRMSFEQLRREFDLPCVRKTHQGYYAILMQDDRQHYAFVFLADDLTPQYVYITDAFPTQAEVEQQLTPGMTEDEVEAFYPNTVPLPVSAQPCSAILVHEGVYLLQYDYFKNGEILSEPQLGKITFFPSDVHETTDDVFVQTVIPYILDIDKALGE